jgi:hypothetical protein
MANGGWHGTQEEWQRAEAPLLKLDSTLEKFSHDTGISLTRNHKDWPERSLKWTSNNVHCLIQIYLDDLEELNLSFGVCAYQDRDGLRYWKNEIVGDDASIFQLLTGFDSTLAAAKHKLDIWSTRPEELEFAMKLTPLPKS